MSRKQSQERRSPLFAPTVRGDVASVQALLDRGEPPEFSAEPHYTPLQAAVRTSHPEIARLLLRHGADPHRLDESGGSALTHAIWNRQTEQIREFLAVGPPQTLRDAAGVGDLALVRELVQGGTPVNDQDYSGFGALYFAFIGGHVEVARFLIAAGATPSPHLTVVAAAALFGMSEVVADQIDTHGESLADDAPRAMWEAVSEGDHVQVVRLLLDRYPTTQEQLDWVLDRASCSCAIESIRLLARRGADVNHAGKEGPLELAREWSCDETVATLIELGARK